MEGAADGCSNPRLAEIQHRTVVKDAGAVGVQIDSEHRRFILRLYRKNQEHDTNDENGNKPDELASELHSHDVYSYELVDELARIKYDMQFPP